MQRRKPERLEIDFKLELRKHFPFPAAHEVFVVESFLVGLIFIHPRKQNGFFLPRIIQRGDNRLLKGKYSVSYLIITPRFKCMIHWQYEHTRAGCFIIRFDERDTYRNGFQRLFIAEFFRKVIERIRIKVDDNSDPS